jgi:transcriptional regulator with XRE-family HTH domain
MNYSTDMIKDNVSLNLGRRVKKLRKERRLSQEDLAEKINMSTDTISNIERASASTTIETLDKIARVFKLEFYELFQFQGASATDKEKIAVFDEIFDLLRNEHTDILNFAAAQTRFILSMKESFINRLKK